VRLAPQRPAVQANSFSAAKGCGISLAMPQPTLCRNKELNHMPKAKVTVADTMLAVPEIDPLELMLRRIDAFVADARALAADLERHLKTDDRERGLLQAAHRVIHDVVSGVEYAKARRDFKI
jgi:hypothetical protein